MEAVIETSFSPSVCKHYELCVLNSTAKDLIKNLLKTNPQERIKIDGALRHPWIASYHKVPETPLASVHVLKDEAEVWGDVQVW